MITFEQLQHLAATYNVPLEDVMFTALNVHGIDMTCEYNRMRMAFHLAEDPLFAYAHERDELDYYFALPVTSGSPFSIVNHQVMLDGKFIGLAVGATEDICDSHYPRRKGTSLNLNANARTACHGCKFCYTKYQIPCDRKRLRTASDLREFFDAWLKRYALTNLSSLIQVSIVTGCYHSGEDVCLFLRMLRQVLTEYGFTGKIFYLGSQVCTRDELVSLEEIKPFGLCFSLETFERRDLLRETKRCISLIEARNTLDHAMKLDFEVNFSYIVGMESLRVMEYHFECFKDHINKFPTINVLQLHKFHEPTLADPEAADLEYFLKTRKMLERLFVPTSMRPLVWEDYRSLWYLTFAGESLYGIRVP